MLNRRILRIKAFKILYAYAENPAMTLKEALKQLATSCEATQDLYLYMLGIVAPLTQEAALRIEAARGKFNPTEEERNPNMKFARNALAPLLAEDIDLQKLLEKKKLSWEQQDAFLYKLNASIRTKDYFRAYMENPGTSLEEDVALFVRIFEEEFVDSPELASILEDMSIWWNDDLAYALTLCCQSLEKLAKGGRWTLPPLYKNTADADFVTKLLTSAMAGYGRYSEMVASHTAEWEQDRLFATDVALIAMGLAEAVTFPEIPVKVTINEYVEISKFYSTPRSRSFVNGLLDKLIGEMGAEGQVVKSGRGLL